MRRTPRWARTVLVESIVGLGCRDRPSPVPELRCGRDVPAVKAEDDAGTVRRCANLPEPTTGAFFVTGYLVDAAHPACNRVRGPGQIDLDAVTLHPHADLDGKAHVAVSAIFVEEALGAYSPSGISAMRWRSTRSVQSMRGTDETFTRKQKLQRIFLHGRENDSIRVCSPTSHAI